MGKDGRQFLPSAHKRGLLSFRYSVGLFTSCFYIQLVNNILSVLQTLALCCSPRATQKHTLAVQAPAPHAPKTEDGRYTDVDQPYVAFVGCDEANIGLFSITPHRGNIHI